MKKNKKSLTFILAGALLAGIGIFLGEDSQGTILVLLNICIGLGGVLFGHGMSNIMIEKAIKNKPNIKEQIKIDENDERNIIIANRAKAKTYDCWHLSLAWFMEYIIVSNMIKKCNSL